MVEKIAKAADAVNTIVKVAAVGYFVWKLGSDLIYGNNASCAATANSAEENKRPLNAEEMKYELDPSQDISSLTCPITMAIIEEPASTVYGHLFELSAIRDWVRMRGVCPLTQQPLRED